MSDRSLWPSPAEIRQMAARIFSDLEAASPLSMIMPVRDVQDSFLLFEDRDDQEAGEDSSHNPPSHEARMDGPPCGLQTPRDVPCHAQYHVRPRSYGEHVVLDANRLADAGDSAQKRTDVLHEALHWLVGRRASRMSSQRLELLLTGRQAYWDHSRTTFGLSLPVRGSAWSGRPLENLKKVRDESIADSDFGSAGRLFLSEAGFEHLAGCLGLAAADRPSRLAAMAMVLAGNDLPVPILIPDFHPSSERRRSVLVGWPIRKGARTPQPVIGSYRTTRNVNNPSMAPGAYTVLSDVDGGLKLHDGHSGGAVLFHSRSVHVLESP